MPYFRKKPVVIEALPWTGRNMEAMAKFLESVPATFRLVGNDWYDELVIPTLEGEMTAIPGDFIIKGVKGEFYPCKPDVFHITYEPASYDPVKGIT